jgi:PTS system nitrogen regulatory IIA component
MSDTDSAIMTLSEVAQYLKVAEKTVLRMIANQEIPSAKVGNQWRFRRDLIDSWLLSRMQSEPENPLAGALASQEYLPLSRVTAPELITTGIRAGSKKAVLEQLVAVLASRRQVGDFGAYLAELLRREEMASTGIGGGVAVPHLRNPEHSLNPGPDAVVGICREGTDFRAGDDEPTFAFFLLSSNSIAAHLKMMSRVARIAREPSSVRRIVAAPSEYAVWTVLLELDQEQLTHGA